MSEEQWQDLPARARSDKYNAVFDVDVPNERARKAASEIMGAFDIRQPRGVRYHNTNEETIAIIIAQNMKGILR